MSVYTDEIFGPVLSVVRVETYDEALELINSNPYGNGTAIFTNDGGAARRFQNEVEVGMIGINVPIPVPMAYYSFGGWKASLFGDTHAHGMDGVHFFTRGKAITSRWLDPSHGGIELGFPQNAVTPSPASVRVCCATRRVWTCKHARSHLLGGQHGPARRNGVDRHSSARCVSWPIRPATTGRGWPSRPCRAPRSRPSPWVSTSSKPLHIPRPAW